MGALPKRKISSYRKGKRRSQKKLDSVQYIKCAQCQKPKLTHQACTHCGHYK